MRGLLLLLFAFPMAGAWNGYVLSGATEGAMASRLVSYGDAFQERTFIAHRDAGGSLAISRFLGTSFTTVTVWNGVAPTHTYVNLSPSGVLLVTFWNNNRFRFVQSVGTGTGNCGPAAEYFCGTVPLPAGHTATAAERIVGEVATNGKAHFVYALRSTGAPLGECLYSTSRTPAGVWSTPVAMTNLSQPLQSPVSFSYGQGNGVHTADGYVTGVSGGIGVGHYSLVGAQYSYGIYSPNVSFANSERRPLARAHCVTRQLPSRLTEVRVLQRNANAQITNNFPVYTPGASASAWCDLALNSSGSVGVVSLATSGGVVMVSKSPARGTWAASPWTVETVDASSTFSRPQVAIRLTGKVLVGYQGSGFYKISVEQ
jgi:hypothetical protein